MGIVSGPLKRADVSWSIYIVDRAGAISTQWPAGLSDSDITTPFPRPLQEYELVCLARHRLILRLITGTGNSSRRRVSLVDIQPRSSSASITPLFRSDIHQPPNASHGNPRPSMQAHVLETGKGLGR